MAELAAQDHPVLINLATVGVVFGVVAVWVGLVGVQSGNATLTAVSWVLAVLLGSSGLVALVKLHAARRVALTRSNLADHGDDGHGHTPRHTTDAVLQHR